MTEENRERGTGNGRPSFARSAAAIIELTGAGALQCLQGLVSSDIVKAGDHSLTYGAILTPKGMIITDCWIVRMGGRLFFLAELEARERVLESFRRTLPPRLARANDLSESWALARLFGRHAQLPVEAARAAARGDDLIVARGTATSWFSGIAIGPRAALGAFSDELAASGVVQESADDVERRRILAGWPRLGAEIDEKTLVQEVRFDEHGGVSYDKGCYVGQETVARLHFRGHTNRNLRGLLWQPGDAPTDTRIALNDKEVGRISSVLALPKRRVALALVRREVEDGAVVVAGGAPATVVSLPFET
jgi:folate-binding protein YgfZ